MVCARANQFAMAANAPTNLRAAFSTACPANSTFCHLDTKIIAYSHMFIPVIECTADQ